MHPAYLRHRAEIEDLLNPAHYEINHVDSEVAAGHWQVFGSDTAVILTELKQYPTGAQEVHGIVAAGALDSILDLIEQAESWARGLGCTGAEISSREGWARVLAGKGYAVSQVTIRKEFG